MGVWIETIGMQTQYRCELSHPSWVCGLKRTFTIDKGKDPLVTPFVGVWIETNEKEHRLKRQYVTPFVGVWIETVHQAKSIMTHPVTPFVGVWIETK